MEYSSNGNTNLEKPASGYEAWDGTSMATPHVSAVAALVWSANLAWTNTQIRQALTATAQDLGTTGRDVYYGYGLVQAKAALDYLGGSTTPETDKLELTVETDKGTYINGEKVAITVTVTDKDGAAISAASVSVQVKTTSATISTFKGSTGSVGTVTLSYRINTRKTGTGSYTLVATATKSGYEDGTASVTFLVQ
ncbi:MAG: S8 family serine peptidase [Anaerolineaceae bacterium]|jgi:subtilisin family serine protease